MYLNGQEEVERLQRFLSDKKKEIGRLEHFGLNNAGYLVISHEPYFRKMDSGWRWDAVLGSF